MFVPGGSWFLHIIALQTATRTWILHCPAYFIMSVPIQRWRVCGGSQSSCNECVQSCWQMALKWGRGALTAAAEFAVQVHDAQDPRHIADVSVQRQRCKKPQLALFKSQVDSQTVQTRALSHLIYNYSLLRHALENTQRAVKVLIQLLLLKSKSEFRNGIQ